DNGIGISEENISKIFNPFFTTRRGSGGSGLGLNIVYNIVTQTLRGSIECGSEPGKGTTFTIIFPTGFPSGT
ncbi:MAG: ATP-binding protein, partial [Spirochaetota bacterium]